jgi:hypothetical protein
MRHCFAHDAGIAQKKEVSSVARQIFSARRINNLQAKEKIFEQSVALQEFTGLPVEELFRKEATGWFDLHSCKAQELLIPIRRFGLDHWKAL